MNVVARGSVWRFEDSNLFRKGDIVILDLGANVTDIVGIVEGCWGSRVRVRFWSRRDKSFMSFPLPFGATDLVVIGQVIDWEFK